MRKVLLIAVLMIVGNLWSAANAWLPDSLCQGYEMRYVDQGSDYSGKVRSTIVRRLAPGSKVGVLYVHGFNDYFFQAQMGDYFVNHGVNFYAVDLRKYGRSLISGQKRFETRDLKEYFPDIDSALVDMGRSGINRIVVMGHSTGGLITTYYLSLNQPKDVVGLILNSPFLDWNLKPALEKVAVPMISAIAPLAPKLAIPQGNSSAYSESLLSSDHGRWTYDTSKKLRVSPPVEASWIRAIDRAQQAVQKGNVVKIPILLMHSDNSVEGDEWTEEFNHGDAVLDVADIARYGRKLGPSIKEATVKGGLHDLVLSQPEVAAAVLQSMLNFVRQVAG